MIKALQEWSIKFKFKIHTSMSRMHQSALLQVAEVTFNIDLKAISLVPMNWPN